MVSGLGAVAAVIGQTAAPSSPHRASQPALRPGAEGALKVPEESAFKISTINQRLATTAARNGGRVDITA